MVISQESEIGSTIAKARGHKYLSETNILAQIGALGNRAIKNGGDNAIRQAFARFARSHSDNNLVKETSVWYVKDPTTGIVEERYPDIPEGATADEINQIVSVLQPRRSTEEISVIALSELKTSRSTSLM